jgi:hypothetical protein
LGVQARKHELISTGLRKLALTPLKKVALMITVYIWKKSAQYSGNGHAALSVAIDNDRGCFDTYISWWPSGDGTEILGSPPAKRTYSADCAEEGRPPEKRFQFSGVFDEQGILDLYNKWLPESYYHAYFKNCATMVRALLCNNGMGKFVQFTNFCSYQSLNTPDTVEFYCDQLQQLLKRRSAR